LVNAAAAPLFGFSGGLTVRRKAISTILDSIKKRGGLVVRRVIIFGKRDQW
jgi:hypothetical protein